MSFYECVGQGGFAWNGKYRYEFIGRTTVSGAYGGVWKTTGLSSNKRYTKIFAYPTTPTSFYSYASSVSSTGYPWFYFNGVQCMQDESGLIWFLNNGYLLDVNSVATVTKSNMTISNRLPPVSTWYIVGIYPDNTGYRLVKSEATATEADETHSDCIACFPQSDFPILKNHSGTYAGIKVGVASPYITSATGAGTYNRIYNGFFSTRKGSSSAAYTTEYIKYPLWCLKE